MKTVIALMSILAIFSSCAATPKTSKSVKTSNAAAIAQADEAFRELDAETAPQKKRGEPKQADAEKPNSEKPDAIKPDTYQEKQRPDTTAEKAKPSTDATYPFKNGYPIWVIDPSSAGCVTPAVGSAKPQQGGFYAQKRAAEMQARAELARMVQVQIDNEIATERYVRTNDATQDMKATIETYSRQRANELLSSVNEFANWLDKGTGVYYVLLCAGK